jgi:hypothetical protein
VRRGHSFAKRIKRSVSRAGEALSGAGERSR